MINEEYKRKLLSLVESGVNLFSDLMKSLSIESNQLSYHLNNLTKHKLLKKTKEGYFLTIQGKNLMPYLRYSLEYDLLPMISVGVFIIKGDKVFLLKRKWEPFKDYYLGISGKLKRHEDVFEAAKKRVKELVNVEVKDLELFCVNNFTSQAHHFVMFFFKGKTDQVPEDGEWISLKELNKVNLFPENRYVLENLINSKSIKYMNSFSEDKTGKFSVLSIS